MPVKPDYVKDLGRNLIRSYPKVFSTNFEHNKEAVNELTNLSSKTVRNRVAGFVTKKMRILQEYQEQEVPEEE